MSGPGSANSVIIGEAVDPHVAAVVREVSNRGSPAPVLLNPIRLSEAEYYLDAENLRLDGVDFPLQERTRGWLRRFVPEVWLEDPADESIRAVERAAWMELLLAIAHRDDFDWLTSFPMLDRAENKAVQYALAAGAGAAVPDWLITSSVSDIDLDEEWVAKPLGPSEFRDPDNERMLVFTSPLPDDASWDGWTLLRGAPFIVQRRIHAEAHFRIVTVRDRAWVSVLRDTSELDWRRSEAAHGAFTAGDTDYDVADMQRSALRIADSAQVGFSSQDWIWDGKQSWFVDLNPAGQWLFLPEPIADDVTVAIAGWLAARSTT